MEKILIGLFKRIICLPIAIVLWLLGHPGIILFGVPHIIYWFLTGRDLMEDSDEFVLYALD
jgi:hypothetical protein